MVDFAVLAEEAKARKAERDVATQRFVQLANGFAIGMDSLRWMSKRASVLGSATLTFRLTDDLLESTFAASANVESGALNPAKRELRYILEQSVKYAFVDRKMQDQTIEKKLQFLEFRAVELVDSARDVALFVPELVKASLLRELGPLYGRLSEFVHPSHRLAEERVRHSTTGHYIGNHTIADVRDVIGLAELVFDISLLYCCQPLGPSLVGDVLLNSWEEAAWWPFHYTPYMRSLSDQYDYKCERQHESGGPVWRRMSDVQLLLEALRVQRSE